MKNKIIYFSIIMIMMFGIVGCEKIEKIETKEIQLIEVNVEKVYHSNAYSTPMIVNNVIMMTSHPATYKVYFEYNGYEFHVNKKEVYDYCKNKNKVKIKVYKYTYEDNEIEYEFYDLK